MDTDQVFDLKSIYDSKLEIETSSSITMLNDVLARVDESVSAMTICSEIVEFELEMIKKRPHLLVQLHEDLSPVEALLDSGSFFSICSKNILDNLRKISGSPLQKKLVNVSLKSHTGDNLDVLGMVNVHLLLPTSDSTQMVRNVNFIETNDKDKILLGIGFMTMRKMRL